MKILKQVFVIIIFFFLSILTQVGGIIYLISLSTHKYINKKISKKLYRNGFKFISFLIIYSIATFLIVPVIAKSFGRVSLPFTKTENLRPLNFLICLLNRQYVKPELKQLTMDATQQLNRKYPGTVVNYLDAGFPFFDGFPLIPHLSHNDGKKLDIAFFYLDSQTKGESNEVPSFIGYGISEEPLSGEINTADDCLYKGFWQYSFMKKIIPQGAKKDFVFDGTRTKELIKSFVANPLVGKVFIEPHLKTRLSLTSNKIRFHGCQAVRHDDHIHIQMN